MKHYVGIDLGGTNLKLGLVTPDGKVVARHSCPTEAARGPEHVLGRMADAVRHVAEKSGIGLKNVAAVGAAVPGPLDWKAGLVVVAPNLPGWKNLAVRDILQKDVGRPVVIENDANAAAYGEFRCGAARAVQSMFILTLGTGVGGGIILGGRMLRGVTDTGAELGHMIIQHGGRLCGCGNRGCLEQYTSATAVVGRMKEAMAAGETSRLAGHDFSCKDVFDAAAAGDVLSARLVEETAEYLGVGITSLLHILNPEMAVLTGGLIGTGEPFIARVRAHVKKMAFERASSACPITWSTLKGDGGIIGAALAAEAFDRTGQPA
jgi:glucokinase